MFEKIKEKINNIMQDMWQENYIYNKQYSDDEILNIVIEELKKLKK